MGAKTIRPDRLDIEAGRITERDVKAAREVAEDVMNERDFARLATRIADELRDSDTSLTRAARDRDRATPRDLSHVESDRLRADPPEPSSFRRALSGRQRKVRSATKQKVLAAAPASQLQAARTMLTDEDYAAWQRINRQLHKGAGDVHQLSEDDRKTVQRLDRLIQSYERDNDRTHTVYVAVKLPENYPDARSDDDLPDTLQPGTAIHFDQFTVAHHNLHETPGHDNRRYLMFEITTSRGMYFGRSDSLDDTTHVLPRGMPLRVVGADSAPYDNGSKGFSEHPAIVQLRDS
ncbi:hypothetical protein [Mycolicibacterium sp.]|uniref:hypothetical protein n=1 Tax=Mycolicibacterium sp. TaxID=2320850 RepID=UPI00355EDB6D